MTTQAPESTHQPQEGSGLDRIIPSEPTLKGTLSEDAVEAPGEGNAEGLVTEPGETSTTVPSETPTEDARGESHGEQADPEPRFPALPQQEPEDVAIEDIPKKIKNLLGDARQDLTRAYVNGTGINPRSFYALNGRKFIHADRTVTEEGKAAAQWLINFDPRVRSQFFTPNSPYHV